MDIMIGEPYVRHPNMTYVVGALWGEVCQNKSRRMTVAKEKYEGTMKTHLVTVYIYYSYL